MLKLVVQMRKENEAFEALGAGQTEAPEGAAKNNSDAAAPGLLMAQPDSAKTSHCGNYREKAE